jgi:hypothetical protein
MCSNREVALVLGFCVAVMGFCGPLYAQTVDRRYTGTAQGFATVLPGFLRQAVERNHTKPLNYEEEARYLIDLVRTCSEITPEMALRMRLAPGAPGPPTPLVMPEADRKYWRCIPGADFVSVSDIVGKNYDKTTERGIVFSITPVGAAGYETGRGFRIMVLFTALESDAPPTHSDRGPGEILIDDYRTTLHIAEVNLPNPFFAGLPIRAAGLEALFDEFGVVCAAIQGPEQRLGPPGVCPPPIPHGSPRHSVDDTFARTLAIVNQNAAAGVPDALAPALKLFKPLPVCYSITARCEQTGEVVRVPGDLDVAPDFWSTLGRHCGPMAHAYEIQVSVKGSPAGGRKRYIDCATALELANRRERLLRYGASGPTSRAAPLPGQRPRSLLALRPGAAVPPDVEARLDAVKFTGTADQFAAAFSGFLRKAAVEAGLNAEAFGKESDVVINAIRTCAQSAPARAAQTRNDAPGGASLTAAVAERYVLCRVGEGMPPNAKYPDTKIMIRMLSDGDSWLKGKGFTSLIFFYRPKASDCPIIYATIPGPNK